MSEQKTDSQYEKVCGIWINERGTMSGVAKEEGYRYFLHHNTNKTKDTQPDYTITRIKVVAKGETASGKSKYKTAEEAFPEVKTIKEGLKKRGMWDGEETTTTGEDNVPF